MSNSIILLNKCRICNSHDIIEYLDLNKTPLANSYIKKEEI